MGARTGLAKIYIEGTKKTPDIDFNNVSGELILAGKSFPENTATVYEPLLKWIEEYIKNPRSQTNLRLNFEYFNTSTSIWIAKIIGTLSKIEKQDASVVIHLYFDAEDDCSFEEADLAVLLESLGVKTSGNKVSICVKIHKVDSEGLPTGDSAIVFCA